MRLLEKIDVQVWTIVGLEVVTAMILFFIGETQTAIILLLILVIHSITLLWVLNYGKKQRTRNDINISRALGNDAKEALNVGKIGIVTYDEHLVITWVSEFLTKRNQTLVNKKVITWLPDLHQLFNGEVDNVITSDGIHRYEVTRRSGARVLFVRDVGNYYNVKERLESEQLVLGLLILDNYNELSQYNDEQTITSISNNIRPIVNQWAKANNVVLRRLKSDRYLMVLNEETYQSIRNEKFIVLNQVRAESQRLDIPVTVSMAFGRGSSDLIQMDAIVNDLMELAQVRGGDQVVSKKHGEDTEFFGGGSQAVEKRSRVRVRVMAQAIKEAIDESNNIFIVGHKVMDYDCMGACLGMASIANSLGKNVYIVSKSGGIEPQLQDTFNKMQSELSKRHRFIHDVEAQKIAHSTNDLVIVVDHHNPNQSNAPLVMEKVEKKIIIDHHRRSERFVSNPLIVYVETSASSSSELVVEMFDYQSSKIRIEEEEAMLLYLGLLIDTNHFKNRTGVRTFEAAAKLKALGVEPVEAEQFLEENYVEFEAKSSILKYVSRYNKEIIIATVNDNQIHSRTVMSQVADQLLSLREIQAVFVIAKIDSEKIGISSRSKERINVQFIMEKMHGGGHFNAAALQRTESSVALLQEELHNVLKDYLEEE